MAKKVEPKKEVKHEKAPAVREHVGGVVGHQEQSAWGGEGITNDDITIPKILLMQPMSDLVTDGIAKIGEFRDSLDPEKMLGNDKTPVEVIVFGTFKTWIEFKDGEFLSIKRMTGENEGLEREEIQEDGSVITRDKTWNFYCLVPSDIESGETFPYVISFRRTGTKAAKDINTYLVKLKMMNKPSAASVFALTSYKETNDKGTFFVPQVKVVRKTTNEEIAAAKTWYEVLGKSNVRVDDSDVTKTTTASSVNATESDIKDAQPVQ